MPSNTTVQPALELIKRDPSKILGLTVGKHNVTEPGQYIPRAGESPRHYPPASRAFPVLRPLPRLARPRLVPRRL